MINDDTISAIATGYGEGGIGIIRISGHEAVNIARQIFSNKRGTDINEVPSHRIVVGNIINPVTRVVIDEVILLIMRAPNSYTCENVIEIHCHGGAIPLKNILELTLKYGARMAEPGEFTKRAFLNGRLDLTQAEAVIDIIRAKTDSSLKVAMDHLSGEFSAIIKLIRNEILELIAHLEVSIDFPDEDVEEISRESLIIRVSSSRAKLQELLDTADTGKILCDGLATVIIGKPNVGKSSLLNELLREKRAIVTDIPGTTRDVIEEYINIRGIPLKIVDTAGIRETEDFIEKIGIEKARVFIEKADLILMLLDSSEELTNDDINILQQIDNKKAIIVLNKSDLPEKINSSEIYKYLKNNLVIKLSALQREGIDELEQAIVDLVYERKLVLAEGTFVTSVRHKNLLVKAIEYLDAVKEANNNKLPEECLVIDLRNTWHTLGEITGETVGEDIIDTIFSQFCIGK